MRTIHNSSHLWGVYLVPGGVPGPGGCTWSWGVYLVQGVYLVWEGVPGPRRVYLVWGVYLVPGGGGIHGPGGVPGPRGLYLVPGGVPGLGVYPVWGVYLVPGGCTWTWEGIPGPGGSTWYQGYLPRYSPHGQTHTCKNITFATSLRTVINNIYNVDMGVTFGGANWSSYDQRKRAESILMACFLVTHVYCC